MPFLTTKQFAYSTIYYTGAHALFRQLSSPAGAILMFHRVQPAGTVSKFSPNQQFIVTPEVLTTVIETLRVAAYDIVSLDEAIDRLGGGSTRRPFACLTFDDGYRDNYDFAWPICQHLDAPLTIYVATGFVDHTDPMWSHGLQDIVAANSQLELKHNAESLRLPTHTLAEKHIAFQTLSRRLQTASRPARQEIIQELSERYGVDIGRRSAELAMSWEMVRELDAQAGVDIGAHTVSHPALSHLSEEDARWEIGESRRILENALQRPIRHFAFPFGDPSTTGPREFNLCRQLGFATAVTTRHGLISSRQDGALQSLPRIPTDPFETPQTLRIKLSGLPGALHAIKQRFTR